jgi:hypothetical protein
MDLITSASSDMYQQAFSPGLRTSVGSITSTDVLILVLIAILIVYLLARTFQGQCRTVCHQICPVNGKEHMSTTDGDCGGSNDQFGRGCTKVVVTYKKLNEAENSSQTLEENKNCITPTDLKVTNMDINGTYIVFGSKVPVDTCPMIKVKVQLNDATGPIVEAQHIDSDIDFSAMEDNVKNAAHEVTADNFTEAGDPIGTKYWIVHKIYIAA